MLINELNGKALLTSAGIATPAGWRVDSLASIDEQDIRYPVALKVQVASGGRGKAGGIRRCASADDARNAFAAFSGMTFDGETPRFALAESWLDIARELYLSVVVDGSAGGYAVLYGPQGGVDVETAGALTRYPVGPASAFRAHVLRELLDDVEPDRRVREGVVALAQRLVDLAAARDCLLVEINPLVVTGDGDLIAADAKVNLDEAAAFRQQATADEIVALRAREPDAIRAALEADLMLVWLDGHIGLVSGGAGMTMAAMDEIEAAGGRAACFLDCSGNPRPAGLRMAIDLLDGNSDVKGILFSMFGGGLQTDRVAKSLVDILAARGPDAKPIEIRLNGTGSDAASTILAGAGHRNQATLQGAVRDLLDRIDGGRA